MLFCLSLENNEKLITKKYVNKYLIFKYQNISEKYQIEPYNSKVKKLIISYIIYIYIISYIQTSVSHRVKTILAVTCATKMLSLEMSSTFLSDLSLS